MHAKQNVMGVHPCKRFPSQIFPCMLPVRTACAAEMSQEEFLKLPSRARLLVVLNSPELALCKPGLVSPRTLVRGLMVLPWLYSLLYPSCRNNTRFTSVLNTTPIQVSLITGPAKLCFALYSLLWNCSCAANTNSTHLIPTERAVQLALVAQ